MESDVPSDLKAIDLNVKSGSKFKFGLNYS